MTTYVWRDGKLVEKQRVSGGSAAPHVSRFESYESPIDGARITSHRQRDLDLSRSSSYDVRDIGPNHEFARAKEDRKNANGRSEPSQLDFWR